MIVGCDPGLDGALAFLDPDLSVHFQDTPTLNVKRGAGNGREYDIHAIRECLRDYGQIEHVYIERQQAMPADLHGRKQGTASSFRAGFGFGIWLGLFVGMGLPYTLIAPVSWKKAMLADLPKGKGSSIIRAKQLYPHTAEQLKRVKDHGRAEALLIATFGARKAGVIPALNTY